MIDELPEKTSMQPLISIVVPVYGCAESLTELHMRLTSALSEITDQFEILMVNDASPDESWTIIKRLTTTDPRVKGINLSRNFSQHRSIYAGLEYAQGENIVVMDCDLQDQPEEIKQLYIERLKGHDIVVGLRSNRKDSWLKITSSKLFTNFLNFMTDSQVRYDETNFTLISRRVLNNLLRLKEQNAYYLLNLRWLGFDVGYIQVEHCARKHGKSSYSFSKLIKLAADSIIAHSTKPLNLMIKFGFLLSVISLSYAAWLIIKYFVFETPVAGWTSLMVSLFFLGGLLFANMGLLGLYIGKSFEEHKRRPLYIVKEVVNLEENSAGWFNKAKIDPK